MALPGEVSVSSRLTGSSSSVSRSNSSTSSARFGDEASTTSQPFAGSIHNHEVCRLTKARGNNSSTTRSLRSFNCLRPSL